MGTDKLKHFFVGFGIFIVVYMYSYCVLLSFFLVLIIAVLKEVWDKFFKAKGVFDWLDVFATVLFPLIAIFIIKVFYAN